MKKTAYVHIGVHKTGTTAIQETLQRFFDEKKLDKFDMQFHHNDLRSSVIDFRWTKDEKYFIEQMHRNIQKWSNLGEKDVILSAETISYKFFNWEFSYDILPVLAKALSDYNIKVIVYIRRQDLFIESLINQYAKIAHYPTCYNETGFYYNRLINRCLECFEGGGNCSQVRA